ELTDIARNVRESGSGLDHSLNVVAPLLMCHQSRGGFDYFRHINRHALAGAQAAEIKQPVGNTLAAKSLVTNQAEIFAQIFGVRRVAKGAFFDSLLQRFGTGG